MVDETREMNLLASEIKEFGYLIRLLCQKMEENVSIGHQSNRAWFASRFHSTFWSNPFQA